MLQPTMKLCRSKSSGWYSTLIGARLIVDSSSSEPVWLSTYFLEYASRSV